MNTTHSRDFSQETEPMGVISDESLTWCYKLNVKGKEQKDGDLDLVKKC